MNKKELQAVGEDRHCSLGGAPFILKGEEETFEGEVSLADTPEKQACCPPDPETTWLRNLIWKMWS